MLEQVVASSAGVSGWAGTWAAAAVEQMEEEDTAEQNSKLGKKKHNAEKKHDVSASNTIMALYLSIERLLILASRTVVTDRVSRGRSVLLRYATNTLRRLIAISHIGPSLYLDLPAMQ